MTPWGYLAVTAVLAVAIGGYGEWRHSAGVNEGELRGVMLGAAQQKKSDDDKQAALVALNKAQVVASIKRGLRDAQDENVELEARRSASQTLSDSWIARGLQRDAATGGIGVPATAASTSVATDAAGPNDSAGNNGRAERLYRALVHANQRLTDLLDADDVWRERNEKLKAVYP